MSLPGIETLSIRRHKTALTYVGLLYRAPQRFQAVFADKDVPLQLRAAALLLFHAAVYVLLLAALGRIIVFAVFGCMTETPLPTLREALAHHGYLLVLGATVGVGLGVGIGTSVAAAVAMSFGRLRACSAGVGAGLAFCLGAAIANGAVLGIAASSTAGYAAGGTLGFFIGLASVMAIDVAGAIGKDSRGRIAAGVGLGVAVGTAIGVGFGVSMGLTFGWHLALPSALVAGVGFGGAFGLIAAIATGTETGLLVAAIFGVMTGSAAGFGFGVPLGLYIGLATGASFGLGFFVAYVRLYYLPFHVLFLWPRIRADWYRFHPVAWDDRCRFAFPGLDDLLVEKAQTSGPWADAEIERLLRTYPTQKPSALRATIRLVAQRARELTNLAELSDILDRLPQGAKGFLAQTKSVRDLAQSIAVQQARYNSADRPAFRELNAKLVCKEIETFRHNIAGFADPLAREFRLCADAWLRIAEHQYSAAHAVVERTPLQQVFRAGDPVDRNTEAFVPRYKILGELERQLLLGTGCPGIILYGRRRMGKSTVLKNLPGYLPPSVIAVVFPMQNPNLFTSLSHFLASVSQGVSRALSQPDGSRLPTTLGEFYDYLDHLNKSLSGLGRRLLICFDEYEYIDDNIGKGRFSEDLLATCRESIQSHRHVTWVFAGGHEVGALTHADWSSYLVSAATIEVTEFSFDETRLLLTDPLRESSLWSQDANAPRRPRFPEEFWGKDVITSIHTECGGWPHLVQLVAGRIVDILNDDDTQTIKQSVLERALDQAVVTGDTVLFQIMHQESRHAGEWEYLARFRTSDIQAPPDDEAVRKSLRRRRLVTVDGDGAFRLRIPLMQRWLRQRT